jgi:hypothetical protein
MESAYSDNEDHVVKYKNQDESMSNAEIFIKFAKIPIEQHDETVLVFQHSSGKFISMYDHFKDSIFRYLEYSI